MTSYIWGYMQPRLIVVAVRFLKPSAPLRSPARQHMEGWAVRRRLVKLVLSNVDLGQGKLISTMGGSEWTTTCDVLGRPSLS